MYGAGSCSTANLLKLRRVSRTGAATPRQLAIGMPPKSRPCSPPPQLEVWRVDGPSLQPSAATFGLVQRRLSKPEPSVAGPHALVAKTVTRLVVPDMPVPWSIANLDTGFRSARWDSQVIVLQPFPLQWCLQLNPRFQLNPRLLLRLFLLEDRFQLTRYV